MSSRSADSRRRAGFLLRLIFNAVALYVTVSVVKGIELQGGVVQFLIAGLLFGALNAFLKPLLFFLSFPVIVLTLGLFYFVVNGVILLVLGWLLPYFSVSGLLPAVLGSLVMGCINYLLHWFFASER
jgi:putative membrane protein